MHTPVPNTQQRVDVRSVFYGQRDQGTGKIVGVESWELCVSSIDVVTSQKQRWHFSITKIYIIFVAGDCKVIQYSFCWLLEHSFAFTWRYIQHERNGRRRYALGTIITHTQIQLCFFNKITIQILCNVESLSEWSRILFYETTARRKTSCYIVTTSRMPMPFFFV